MGEIATWSAVKTKVGLGKDSNECPTKAELLALSPTGTGENYVGLEISNASSYGNNETVQLSDIHKVTYKYVFTVENPTLTFTPTGGVPTPPSANVASTREKILDGVATGTIERWSYNYPALPAWLTLTADLGYRATENTTTSKREFTHTLTQQDSGKQLTITLTQAAGVETWEYTFTAQNTTLNFPAAGGSGTPGSINITSTKQRFINGSAIGSAVSVAFTRQQTEDWEHNVEGSGWIADENKSESSRSRTIDYIQDESGKKVTVTFAQAAGVKTYGTPTVYLGSIADIPASGGTAATPTYTYSQLWGWNGKTNDGGTISSGASVVWSENISGSNLGTTAKARTKLGSRTLTVTLNGKSGSASVDVYQAENKIENVTQGGWVVSISANPSTFTEQGGTSQISSSARASRTNHWSSGATSAASDVTGTPTLSIPTPVTGFSLSGTTLTVAENTTANQRSVVVRATMDTVYKEVTVTQSAYLVEWRYTLTTSTPTLNFDALGTTKSGTISSYREKYINGSLVEGSLEGVNIQVKSTSAEIQSATAAVAITLKENTTTQARTGTVVYEQVGSGKTVTITCNQAAGTVTTREELVIKESFPTAPNTGGTIKALVRSGYWDVVNGKDTVWHDEAPTVKTKPSFVSSTDVTYELGVGYRISATMPENTSESQLSGSLNLEYGSKTLSLGVKQAGASITYNYYLAVTTDFPSVAAAGAIPKAVIKSRRYRVVNGVEESSYTLVDVSVFSKPDWTGVLSYKISSTTGPGADYDVTLPVYENTSESIRRGTVVLQQSGSNKQITLNLNQSAAVVTTRDHIEYRTPLPSGDFNAENQGRSIFLISYRETLINGTVTNKVGVEPTWILSLDTAGSWASLASLGPSPSNPYEFEIELTVEENTTNQTRSGSVMFKNGTEEVENAFAFTQDAATITTRYDIFWRLSNAEGNTDRVTEIELEGSAYGEAVDVIVIMNKITTINGNETSTPIGTDTEQNALRLSGGNLDVSKGSYSRDETGVFDLGFQLQVSSDNLEVSAYTISASLIAGIKDGNTEVGTAPNLSIKVLPVPYQRRFTFGWKGEGSIITNITLDGDIYGSSAGSRDIISYASLRRDGVEFAKAYIKPTFTPPSEDWLQVIDNGQNSDNSYNYAFKALTNNEGESARNQSVRFEQSGNSQALQAYVSQDPMATTREEFHAELGNYYSYGDSNQIPLIYRWYSPDSSDTTGIGDMTPGGYTGVWCNLPATGVINCMITGKPQTGKPMKARLSNLQARTIEDFDSSSPTEINKGLSVGYSQQDYKIGIEYSPGMNNYFLITPSILSEAGAYGGGIRLEVSLRSSYSSNGTTIATVTLTPKNSDHPTIYFEVIYG